MKGCIKCIASACGKMVLSILVKLVKELTFFFSNVYTVPEVKDKVVHLHDNNFKQKYVDVLFLFYTAVISVITRNQVSK